MRSWRLTAVGLVCIPGLISAAISTAQADDAPGDMAASAEGTPAADPRPPQRVGYAALPGGIHVAAAESLPAGTLGFGLLSGFGYRKGLLAADHTFDRALGSIAVAYAPVPNLAIALSLDGRYDSHNLNSKSDDGYVGDPHLLIRLAAPMGKLSLGGQLGVWVPGKDAPSIAASAISFDARGLLSFDVGFGQVSVNAGFRLDNSAKSVDKPEMLSAPDRVSLGVSNYHAALAGASLRIPVNQRWYVELEGSTDVFVGSGAPGPILRAGGLFGVAVNDAVSLIGYVEGAKVPSLSYSAVAGGDVALVPYEPVITGGLGLQARFGGPRRVAAATGGTVVKNGEATSVTVIELADVTGTIVDDAGKPVIGAQVTVKLKNNTGTAPTDDKGAFRVPGLPIGKTIDGKTELDDTGAEVTAEVANKKPASLTLTLSRGANTIPRITLDPLLPPGQLRAVIINLGNSRPVVGATVTVEPGGVTATSGSDGKFTVDLPPGKYKITVTAKGLAQQQLDVNIDPNGVAIKNIEMRK
jgi:hypothetical protein